jgi:glycosyltransferase 2 family protein
MPRSRLIMTDPFGSSLYEITDAQTAKPHRTTSLPLSFVDCLLGVLAVLLLALLPISIGGWGVHEGAIAAARASYAISSDLAITLSALFGIVQLVVGLIGGAWLLASR